MLKKKVAVTMTTVNKMCILILLQIITIRQCKFIVGALGVGDT
jgi:hypothetical protein